MIRGKKIVNFSNADSKKNHSFCAEEWVSHTQHCGTVLEFGAPELKKNETSGNDEEEDGEIENNSTSIRDNYVLYFILDSSRNQRHCEKVSEDWSSIA